MATSKLYPFPSVLSSFSSSTDKSSLPIYFLCFSSFQPFSSFKLKPPSVRVFRSKFSRPAAVTPRHARLLFTVRGLVDDDSAADTEPESGNSEKGATINLQLPRRSLLVQFTCNLCGEKTKRLVNRLAYERGVIFVQCAGCLQHHKLVDNLGLITEYDFREEANTDSEVDQA